MSKGNHCKGPDRVTNQVKDAIAELKACGLKRNLFRVRAETHTYQRNGHKITEFGRAHVIIRNTKEAAKVLDKLKEKFQVIVYTDEHQEIRLIFCQVPGRFYDFENKMYRNFTPGITYKELAKEVQEEKVTEV